jgi:hypothetical protein
MSDSVTSESADVWAGRLVGDGSLTGYQAQKILRGRAQWLVFGEYLLIDRLGAGGMGKVYRAQHRRMKRVVALKVLPAASHDSGAALRRFQLEVEAAARLTHPNIVMALDAGEVRGRHYLVMECVEGDTLAALVRQQGPLAVDRAVRCVVDAARGLEYAHSKGVVHRDIKPSNLLMSRDGTVKILDLGLARLDGGLSDDESLTTAGSFLGTTGYAAPEQAADSKRVDPRADIYSLGCTLHFLLTGRPPYRGATALETLLAHRDAVIPALGASRADISTGLEQTFRRMVAKAPEHRFPSMAAARGALEQSLLSGGGLPPALPTVALREPPPLAAPPAMPRPQPVALSPAPATVTAATSARPVPAEVAMHAIPLAPGGPPAPERLRRRVRRRQGHPWSLAIIAALLLTMVVLFPRYMESLRGTTGESAQPSAQHAPATTLDSLAKAPGIAPPLAEAAPSMPPIQPRAPSLAERQASPTLNPSVVATAETPARDKPAPKPPASEARLVATAIVKLRARYAKDLAAANTPWRKGQLAKGLVAQLSGAGDKIEQLAQCDLALELAAAAVDAETAIAAADARAQRLGQDRLRAKVAAVTECADGLTALKQSKAAWQAAQGDVLACGLADRALTLDLELVAADQYTVACRLALTLKDALATADEPTLAKQWAEIGERNEQRWKLYSALPPANSPDAAAQAQVGRFLCYCKQQWSEGLKHLERGDQPVVQDLARLEQANPSSIDDRLRLAAGWWAIADAAGGMARESIRRHAASWYNSILPGMPPGETREAIESRLAEAGLDAVSQATAAAVEWLSKHQEDNGSWTFDLSPAGTNKSEIAATALALRALLTTGGNLSDPVRARAIHTGLAYLRKQGKKGDFRGDKQPSMYVQAVAAIALCEASVHLKDLKLHKEAQEAVQFIVLAQDPQAGGWRYQPGEAGDVSATGWQVVALEAGKQAHLTAGYPRAFRGVKVFLDTRTTDSGLSYFYHPDLNTPNSRITAVALVCRVLLRGRPFEAKDPDPLGRNALAATARIAQDGPSASDPYFNYYATRLLQLQAGESWKPWRRAMAERLLKSQETAGDSAGSWFPGWGGDAGDNGSTLLAQSTGRLGVTAVCLLTLADCALGPAN